MKGEAEAAYEMEFHYGASKNWMVLHDLRLECEGRVAQIDHLLLNRFLEIYVCESKRFSEGVLEATAVDHPLIVALTFAIGLAGGNALAGSNPWNTKANAAIERGDTKMVASLCARIKYAVDAHPHPYVEVILTCAQSGNARAMGVAGWYYNHYELDPPEAFHWNTEGARRKDARAMRELCIDYAEGIGTRIDYDMAVKWCRESARRGDKYARSIMHDVMFKRNLSGLPMTDARDRGAAQFDEADFKRSEKTVDTTHRK